MRLALLSPLEAGSMDAISTHTLELARNLVPLVQKVHLVVRRWSGEPLKGVSVHELGTLPIRSVSDFIGAFLTMRRLSGHVDVVYTRSPFMTAGAVLGCGSAPVVYEVNGLVSDEQQLYGGVHRLVGWAAAVADRIALKRASHVVAITQGIRDRLIEMGVPFEHITVIENGADIELFSPVEDAKQKLGLSSPVVCFVGSLAPWQGVEQLVGAAPQVLEHVPDAHFLIVGGGALESELRQMVKEGGMDERFTFTGAVPYEKVPLYINAADVCVVCKKPMRSGYSPLKLYEYMACAKPVVASRACGFEVLESVGAGLLVSPDDPEELAGAVVSLLKDEGLRE
ncbi:MAG: glycosyltransferase family 4 protein, partial [Methermicoccaceae archaeon]